MKERGLGEVLAEFENRIAVLENSMPYSTKEEISPPKLLEPEWTKRQYDKVQQLQSEVEDWREKHSKTLLAVDKLTKKIKLYEGGDLT